MCIPHNDVTQLPFKDPSKPIQRSIHAQEMLLKRFIKNLIIRYLDDRNDLWLYLTPPWALKGLGTQLSRIETRG